MIITDNLMPDLDGADAAAIIYAERPTPIILLSGYCDRNLVLDAEQKHVLIYLVKPISEANLPRPRLDPSHCRALVSSPPGFDEPADEPHAEPILDAELAETSVRSPSTSPYPQAIRPSHYIEATGLSRSPLASSWRRSSDPQPDGSIHIRRPRVIDGWGFWAICIGPI